MNVCFQLLLVQTSIFRSISVKKEKRRGEMKCSYFLLCLAVAIVPLKAETQSCEG